MITIAELADELSVDPADIRVIVEQHERYDAPDDTPTTVPEQLSDPQADGVRAALSRPLQA
jgi:hypothetical protein